MRFRFTIFMLGLIALTLTACGGGSSNSATNNSQPASTSIPTAPTVAKSNASMTTSGGLSGTYTINDQAMDSTYNQNSSGKLLKVAVNDSSWELSIQFPDSYAGPGSYTIGAGHGSLTFYAANHMKGWDLIDRSGATLTCKVNVSADTTIQLQGSPGAEVKGTFSCPKLNSDAPTHEQPIALSNGQFDVVMQKTNV